MPKIQIDINVANGVAIYVLMWNEVCPFRYNESKSMLGHAKKISGSQVIDLKNMGR